MLTDVKSYIILRDNNIALYKKMSMLNDIGLILNGDRCGPCNELED